MECSISPMVVSLRPSGRGGVPWDREAGETTHSKMASNTRRMTGSTVTDWTGGSTLRYAMELSQLVRCFAYLSITHTLRHMSHVMVALYLGA